MSIVQPIFTYLSHSAAETLLQLLIVLGPILLLAFLLHYLSHNVRTRAARFLGVDGYTWFTAPGVMIHELGHAFFCVIFGHRIVRMRLFSPGHEGSLGVVEHSYNPRNPYHRIGNFFIGTGPIWFGSAIILILALFLLSPVNPSPSAAFTTSADSADPARLAMLVAHSALLNFASFFRLANLSTWQFWLFAYLVFCIGSHITLSRSDIQGAWGGFVSLVAALFLFNLLTLWLGGQFATFFCQRLLRSGVDFYAAALFVLALNLFLAIATRLFSSILNR